MSFDPPSARLVFGNTRTQVTKQFALIAPDGHISSRYPGIENGTVVNLISPALGAGFTQLLVSLTAAGWMVPGSATCEHFIYSLQGQARLQRQSEERELQRGDYVFLPAGEDWSFHAAGATAELMLFKKPYVGLTGAPVPGFVFGAEKDVPAVPFMGDPRAVLQVLLPDEPAFDLAINIFNFEPGAYLPLVETHVMEHGLYMLAGMGVYRLSDNWHPVAAGDCIWMAPFCPQWFTAMGTVRTRYLYYKDVNRAT